MSQCPFATFPNMIDPETYVNGMPYETLREIRQSGPVHYVDDSYQGVPYWLITGRDEIDFISKNPKLFSSEARSAIAEEFTEDELALIHRNMTINQDPPRQMKSRKIVRATFTPAAVNSYEKSFRQHAKNIVDRVAGRGECEFVEEVAAELPLLAILELCGIPPEDRKDFFEWTNKMMFNQDPEMAADPGDAEAASFKVIEYAMKLMEKHKANPKKDIIGALIEGNGKDDGLSDEEFVWFFLMLIAAGNESTRTVTTQGMRMLMENPDQLQYLVDNPDKIPGACEEMLRYNTAFTLMRRQCMEDTEVGGHLIKKGDKVIMHYHTVNHDETIFGEDAMKFDVRRAERMPNLYNEHRAFGVGQHFCLGTHLARLEMRVMFEEIIPRIRNPKLVGDIAYTRSNLVNGIKRMQITFDPEVKASDKAA